MVVEEHGSGKALAVVAVLAVVEIQTHVAELAVEEGCYSSDAAQQVELSEMKGRVVSV